MSKLIPGHQHGEIDLGNSTSTPLAGGAAFTGEWIDITEYGIIYVSTYSDVASATDGLCIEQSSDAVNTDHDDCYTINAGSAKNFSINPFAQYMRVIYTNGAGAQSAFRLQTKLNTNGLPSSHRIQDSISTEDDARLVKAVMTGKDPVGDFINFEATRQGNFKVSIQEYGDTAAIDAFDRLRVSQPFTISDNKQLYDKQPLFFDEITAGSATSTHSTTNARVRMTVTASASDYAMRQSKQRYNYQPGKSTLIFFTFYSSQETGVTKRMGYFDGTGGTYMTANNGIFLQIDDTNISWNIAKNGTTTETVTQSSWNVDKLDGTGASGITLDPDAVQIGILDIEYLGVGRCRVGFVIGGVAYYCHYFNHANDSTYTSVYMSSPNLPIRYDIASDGTGGGDLDHICSTVISEGGVELTGVSRSIDTQNTHLDANAADTTYVVLALRLKSTHLDLTVLPQSMSMISETNDDFRWSILLNPTYASTLTYADITNSGCQRAAGGTANTISAEGTKLASGYAKSAGSVERNIVNNLRIGSQIDGTRDELILAVTPLASNADIHGSLTFRELL
jgi:hypothetical protein